MVIEFGGIELCLRFRQIGDHSSKQNMGHSRRLVYIHIINYRGSALL